MKSPNIYGIPIKGIPGWFMPLWCTLMPLTSLVLIPSVPGTIIPYLLAFASVFIVLLSHHDDEQTKGQRFRYFAVALLVLGIWVLLLSGSQLGHIFSDRRDFGDLSLIDPDDTRVLLRKVLFTQSLYLAACTCIALFFRFYFRPEWMRYVLWGGWFLAVYGIYEWLFFLIFQQPGDFFVNRTYADGLHTGSWSQAFQLGPFNLLRIKSTFGEPSFFSAGALPYIFLAIEHKRKWLSAALLFCIVFSASSSAFAAFPFALLLYSLFQRKLNRSILLLLLFFAAAFAILYFVFPENFDNMFTSKLSGDNDSGHIHQKAFEGLTESMNTFTFVNHLFGIGFGYSYAAVFYSVLVNTGWIGMLVYCYAFLKPVVCLRPDHGGLALKVGVATLFFLYYINVSELFLPTTWMFLGLAYRQLDQQRREKMALRSETFRTPFPAGQRRIADARSDGWQPST